MQSNQTVDIVMNFCLFRIDENKPKIDVQWKFALKCQEHKGVDQKCITRNKRICRLYPSLGLQSGIEWKLINTNVVT